VSSTLSGSSERAALLAALDRELRRMSGQSVLFSHAVAERLGLHSSDMECLDFLHLEGPLTAGRLAELTGLTTGAVTRMIDRLERAGWAHREADPRDRRRVIVHPDPERARAAGPLYEGMRRAMEDVCAGYTDAELALVLDFAARAGEAARAQTALVRAADGSARPGRRAAIDQA
jgi:DNA-binding MarR family transcriptional regulator